MTWPNIVINPLIAARLGLGGDGFLGSLSPRVMDTLLGGQLSFPLAFHLGASFSTTLGADAGAPSFPFAFFSSSFLHAAAALTCALCLAASISTKDKWRVLDQETKKKERRQKEIGNNLRWRE